MRKGESTLLDLILKVSPIFIAGFAVVVSCLANMRASRAEKETKKLVKAMTRMDLLVEIESQHSVTGKLALVTAKSLSILQEFPNIIDKQENEVRRLNTNLEALQKLKDGETEQRVVSEAENDVLEQSKALTDVRRLRVRMEGELEKETNNYKELMEKSKV